MGKKKEEKEQEEASAGGPDDVFKSLFGDATEQHAFSSLFSDNNPFKRKHGELNRVIPISVNPDEETTPKEGDSPEVEVKRRKASRDSVRGDAASHKAKPRKEKRKDASSASENVLKQLKRGSAAQVESDSNATLQAAGTKPSNSGLLQSNQVFGNGELEGRVVGTEVDITNDKDQKQKNKRKRDELERAYETVKYGSSVGEERHEGAGEKVVGKKRKKAEDPADVLVTKEKEEGFDDEDKLLRTVFVGNLPLKMKKKALMKEFETFGEIESLRIRSVPILETKTPRKGAVITKKINDAVDSVHAYVVFKSEESATASLVHNMAVVEGKHVRVDRACPPRKKLKGEDAPVHDNKRTVFVGNLPFDAKDEELYQLFARINNLESSIEAVRVVRDPHTSMGKGIAYVLLKTREAANQVVKKRSLNFRGRELRLSHARPDTTPSKKRNNPSSVEAANMPSKKLALDSSTTDKEKRPSKADLSYQGLHGKKASSVLKKTLKKSNGAVKPEKASMKRSSARKERTGKRPAVAARKAKAKAMREAGFAPKQTDKKRKLDDRKTPDSFQQKRKVKKFK